MEIVNVKIYLNGKRLRKKIKINNNGWQFVRPLKLSEKDLLTYTWELKTNEKN